VRITDGADQEMIMYQPYPSGAEIPDPAGRVPPPPVLMAVRLMFVGAGISVLGLVANLVTVGSLKGTIEKAYPAYTASHVHTVEIQLVVSTTITALIAVGLWIWMALANKAGKSWARIISTILFAFNTVFLLLSLLQPHASLGLAASGLVWLAGLGATILIWRRESGPYYATKPGQDPAAEPG
jgi:hypothetical protein